jgi:hypothetical protein
VDFFQAQRNALQNENHNNANDKSSRWVAMLLATIVAISTCMAVANATQTITTPNAAFISYNLAAGANSAAITPASNRWVLVGGCCTTFGGVGQVSLLHDPSVQIAWVGLESQPNAAITQGITNTTGIHIVYIDGPHAVEIQTASVDRIRIHNGSGGTRAGNVTLIW